MQTEVYFPGAQVLSIQQIRILGPPGYLQQCGNTPFDLLQVEYNSKDGMHMATIRGRIDMIADSSYR